MRAEIGVGKGRGTIDDAERRSDDWSCRHWRAWHPIRNPGCGQELCASEPACDDADHDDAWRCESLVEVLLVNDSRGRLVTPVVNDGMAREMNVVVR